MQLPGWPTWRWTRQSPSLGGPSVPSLWRLRVNADTLARPVTRSRTPRNAPGPFYVLKDSCISCGAPEGEAPELIGYDEEASSCYFKRQPATPVETYRAIRAVWASCCGALEYDGPDPAIHRRTSADAPVRSCVTFTVGSEACSSERILALVSGWLGNLAHGSARRHPGPEHRIQYSWSEITPGVFFDLSPIAAPPNRWRFLIGPPSSPARTGAALRLDDCFSALAFAYDIRWSTESSPEEWSPHPL